MKLNTSRRCAIFSLCLAAGWLFKPRWALTEQCLAATADEGVLRKQLVRAVKHIDSAPQIGEVYLKEEPAAASANYLIERICGPSIATRDALMRMSRRQWNIWIYDRIRYDFQTGRVTVIDGWMLSDTEVHLCALVRISGSA